MTQQGLKAIAPYPSSDNPATFAPAGNVHCSLEDWGKFIQLHIQGFNHEKNLLVTVESMTKLHTAYPNQDYAYGGWGTLQRRWAGGFVLAHEGSNTLNLATVYVAPLQKRAFLAVTNLGIEAPETRVATQAAIEKMIKLDLPVETNQTR